MLSWRVTYMERVAPPGSKAPDAPLADIAFARQSNFGLDAYRDLHRKVGEDWLWWERLALDDDALAQAISTPGTEIYTLSVAGALAGFTELDRRNGEAPAIRYFGLKPDFIGRRLGGYMMECLLHQVWHPPVRRITLDTCDLDHPSAIAFYSRHGFNQTGSEMRQAIDPRESGILPRGAAAHIPLNRQF